MSDCPHVIECCPGGAFAAATDPAQRTVYYSVEKSYTANCTGGATGSNSVTIPARSYYSYESQQNADDQAAAAAKAQAEAGLVCIPPQIEGKLSGLMWIMPCRHSVGDPSPWSTPCEHGPANTCYCQDPNDQVVVLDGASDHTYQVRLRIRGVVELNPYYGGSVMAGNNLVYIDPAGPFTPGNTYSLLVSNPLRRYCLNNNYLGYAWCRVIDYYITIPMAGGASVTISARSGDNLEVTNCTQLVGNLSAPDDDVAHPIIAAQPYPGQFVQMDVYSVTY